MWVSAHVCRCPPRGQRIPICGIPGVGVTGGHEPPEVGVEDQTANLSSQRCAILSAEPPLQPAVCLSRSFGSHMLV